MNNAEAERTLSKPLDILLTNHHGKDLLVDDETGDSAINSTFTGSPTDRFEHLDLSDTKPCTSEEEEHFESYGENDETDSQPSGLLDTSNLDEQIQSCHCKRTRTRREAWARNKRISGLSRRVSSNALASQLYRASLSGNSSPYSDGMSTEEIADDVYDLNTKVQQLEMTVTQLAESQQATNDRHIKLKQDNAALTERVHMLEEQLRDTELRAERQLRDEQRRHEEAMLRLEKEKTMEVESLTYQLKDAEKQCKQFEDEIPRLKAQIERFKMEKQELQSRLSDVEYNKGHLEDSYKILEEKCHSMQHDLQLTNNTHSQVMEEMSKELDELKQYRRETEVVRNRSPSLLEYPSRFKELETQINHLKNENNSLRETNDELQVHLLNQSLQEGKNLLNAGAVSLADEFDNLSRDEVMDKLKEQQDENVQLRQYVDRILMQILENNPSMLEIKTHGK